MPLLVAMVNGIPNDRALEEPAGSGDNDRAFGPLALLSNGRYWRNRHKDNLGDHRRWTSGAKHGYLGLIAKGREEPAGSGDNDRAFGPLALLSNGRYWRNRHKDNLGDH